MEAIGTNNKKDLFLCIVAIKVLLKCFIEIRGGIMKLLGNN